MTRPRQAIAVPNCPTGRRDRLGIFAAGGPFLHASQMMVELPDLRTEVGGGDLPAFVMSRATWLEQAHGLDGLSRIHHRIGQVFLAPLIAHPLLILAAYGQGDTGALASDAATVLRMRHWGPESRGVSLTQVSTVVNVLWSAAWKRKVTTVSLVRRINDGCMDADHHPLPWSSVHEVTRRPSSGGCRPVCQHGAGTAVR